MDDITIRKATPKDAEAACAVLVRSIKEICAPYYENDEEILAQWLENKTPANVRRWIESDRSYCVVAVTGKGLVVGFGSISGSEIMLNYVLPEALYQGIGKGMLQALETQAIASGVEHIDVVSTIPAKVFYERNGYVSNGAPRQVGRIIGDFPLVKTMFSSPDNRYFEDYVAGSVHEFGSIVVDETEVLEFGQRFVPLSYHTDPEAAKKSIYGGLIASGWHTAALMMRLYTDHYLSKVANLGSPGCDELRWSKPVFPGDQLSIRVTVSETPRSDSKPNRASFSRLRKY